MSSPDRSERYSFTPWPWEVAELSQPPAPTLREALLVGSGVCLTRWERIENQWQVEARADGLDTLLRFRLESLDRVDAMVELLGGGSPVPVLDAMDVLRGLAADVAACGQAQRILACIRAEASGAPAESEIERVVLDVLPEILDPDPLAAAQAAQRGVLRVAAALGVGPRSEILLWQDEVLIRATPWRPAPPDLTPLVDPLRARREG